MPIIFLKISPASSGLRASFTPPPLPRPPAWIWAFTTTTPLPEAISSRAAATASSADCTSLPRGTATPCARRISLAWYSWIFMAAPQYTAPPGTASAGSGRPAPPRAQERLELQGLDRTAEVIALRVGAAHLAQQIELLLGLHALGHHLHVQAVGEREDGVDDLQPVVGGAHALDEAAVDLERIDGELVQVAEGAVPGPEVVQIDADAHRPQLDHGLGDVRVLVHQQRLGDLEPQRARGEPGGLQHLGDLRDQTRHLELPGADVHADLQLRLAELLLPLLHLPARFLEHPGADLDDQPRLLGEWNEIHRRHQAALRVLPAQQRLGAGDLPRGQRHDRLVVDAELAAVERAAQGGFQVQQLHRPVVHADVELDAAPATLRLGPVERGVRVAEDVLWTRVIGVPVRNADRRAAEHLLVRELERRPQLLVEAVGDLPRVRGVGHVLEQDGELVAAEPRHRIAGAQRGLEPAAHLDEELVSEHVAEAVVDHLEAVDVQHQHREAGLVPPLLQREAVLEAVEEERAVGQAGEGIVERVVEQLVGGAAPIGHVSAHGGAADHAAVPFAQRDDVPLHHPPVPGARQHLAFLERAEQAAGQHRLEVAALPALALVLRDAELEPVLPQHLVPLVPRHPQHRVVAELDAALGIELEDEELRLLQQLAQPAISLALRRLRAHPFADVEDRAADHLLAADDHGALVRFQVDQLAVPARGAHDVGHPALPLRFRQREIGGMDQLEKRATDQLLRLPADHPSRGRVDPDDAVARQDVETCEAVIEHEGEMVREHRGLLDNTAKIPGGYKATCSHGAPDSLRPCARSSAIRTRSHFLPATASPCPSTGCCGSASSPRECWVPRNWRSPTSSIALRSCWPTPRSIWTRSSPERFRSPNSAGLDSPGARRWSRGRGRASSAPSPPPARRCGTGWREISPAARTTPTPTAGRASASSTTSRSPRGRSSGRGSSTAPWWSIWTSTRATGRRRSSPATRASSPSPCTARRTSPFASSARRWTSSSRTGVEILNILRRSRSTCRRCSIAPGRTSSSSRPGSIRSSTTSSGASSSRRQGFDCATASWPAPRATAASPWC